MAQCHLGHNCEIQDNTIIANSALLSGYVKVEPYAFISGNVVVHQFCRIGRLSMSGGFTGVNKDVPPYMIVRGPSAIRSINLVGLRRAGKSREVIRELMEVFKLIYMSDLRMDDVLKKIKEECKSQEAQEIAVFIEQSKRGICKYRYSREEYFE
jgi:UDP-N-acetylglucosamine acyltransferase